MRVPENKSLSGRRATQARGAVSTPPGFGATPLIKTNEDKNRVSAAHGHFNSIIRAPSHGAIRGIGEFAGVVLGSQLQGLPTRHQYADSARSRRHQPSLHLHQNRLVHQNSQLQPQAAALLQQRQLQTALKKKQNDVLTSRYDANHYQQQQQQSRYKNQPGLLAQHMPQQPVVQSQQQQQQQQHQLPHSLLLQNKGVPRNPFRTHGTNNSKISSTGECIEFEKIFLDKPKEDEFRSLGLCYAGFGRVRQDVRDRSNDERFSAFYGVGAKTLLAVFVDAKDANSRIKTKDFFMTVNELKLYLTEHVQAGNWGIDESTFRKKWKEGVKSIAALKEKKIKFDPDDFPENQIYIMSVDGVNFTIREPRAKNPGSHWYDHKSHSAGVSYEVAIDIRRSRILWINGPRPASVSESVTFNGGKKKDMQKDMNCLSAKIPEGKRAIADSGFRGSDKVSTTKPGHSRETKVFMSRVRSRMETLFTRLKNFGILRQRFRHDLELHQDILNCVAVLVAYDMENGHPLFDV